MVMDSVTAEISSPMASGPSLDSGERKLATPDFDMLHRRLEKERESLQNRLGIAIRPVDNGQSGSYSRSDDELASDNLESWKREMLKIRLREQMVEVERALRKFEEGTYGLCDICGSPIAPERLEALPRATVCFNCKTRTGKNSKR